MAVLEENKLGMLNFDSFHDNFVDQMALKKQVREIFVSEFGNFGEFFKMVIFVNLAISSIFVNLVIFFYFVCQLFVYNQLFVNIATSNDNNFQ